MGLPGQRGSAEVTARQIPEEPEGKAAEEAALEAMGVLLVPCPERMGLLVMVGQEEREGTRVPRVVTVLRVLAG
jgi:hypothetical protein